MSKPSLFRYYYELYYFTYFAHVCLFVLVRCVWQENTIHCHSNSLLTVFFLILNKRLFFFFFFLIKDCFCGLLPEVVQRSIKHNYHLFSAEYENTLTLWESCLYNRYQLCYYSLLEHSLWMVMAAFAKWSQNLIGREINLLNANRD